eukprot:gnl/MRDRNA2_/MRDRNA2_109883_c0_seq1.p1 gnl/MRDRNA2_/MRDRNA2_109883_c0~~gnl/MRDRNA2_/MRDRNA2_109883_c0_seq1.p1  ORF type:complete len:343 (+),score=39.69 gnl/MRDRNA2_/MRDRNA2_109883_c0_seq1:79-1107(+)
MANEPGVAGLKTLEFAHLDNHGFCAPHNCDESNTYEKIVVWGGQVFNCGESDLSQLVDKNRHSLQELIYLPEETKGGVMIRPKYYQGDRRGVVAFPKLREMTIKLNSEDVLTSPFFPWETVNLQHVRLVHVLFTNQQRVKEYRSFEDFDYFPDDEPNLPLATQLRCWLGTYTKQGHDALDSSQYHSWSHFSGVSPTLAQKVAARYPKLEAISIALTSTKSINLGGVGALPVGALHDWAVLYVPKPVPWEIHRVLLLGLGSSGSDGSKVTGIVDSIGSPFLMLSHEVLNDWILPFLGRRNWELKEFPIPETWRKELRLLPELLSDKASDMLKRDDNNIAPKKS